MNREVQVNDKERDDEGISKMDDRDKVKGDDDSDSDSSSDEEVDIGRGEGDLMSSSDEEDDEGLDFQKAEVGSHIVMQGLHLSLLCAKAFWSFLGIFAVCNYFICWVILLNLILNLNKISTNLKHLRTNK